ncbi:hypothetical protein LCGC14_0317290 [marine sediment metagenome]|uniref:Antitoxin Xre/MbcA/ParS-like toxin-binding domain-containing protein n=1 Tax=marine sediment metagenome TaxID=412755 RepID=A0A0F9WS80_9ZZZZ|nr:BPSL0761 family protein [Halomonas sp.]HEB06604.1 DUF2384 domain-containing protein [Halomonas sp.]
MTLPNERTRAIIQTEIFLIELSKDKSIADEKRQEARRLLRHYPSRKEMLLAGEIEEKLTSGTLFNPIFSSTLDTVIPDSLTSSLYEDTDPQQLARNVENTQSADKSKQQIPTVIWRAAVELFGGNQSAADQWLHSEAMGLGWKRPIDVMQEDTQKVLDLITRIDRGVYT